MESTLQGLNITVAGMGLVFFALAVVMVAVIGLDRLFPGEATGGAAAAGPTAAILPTPQVPPPPPARGLAPLQAVVGDKTFLLEPREVAGTVRQFAVGQQVFKVERSRASIGEILIDGEPYRVDVTGAAGGSATVKVGGQTLQVSLRETVAAAPSAAPANPAAHPASAAPAGTPAGRAIPSPLPGKILRVVVAVGDRVTAGQELCVLEAMKMENSIKAQAGGVVRHVVVAPGQSVAPGETLMWIE